jgi:hypothetical protein
MSLAAGEDRKGGTMARKTLLVLVLLVAFLTTVFSQTKSADIVNFISSAHSVKNFTAIPVDPKDLELILHCGVQATTMMRVKPPLGFPPS